MTLRIYLQDDKITKITALDEYYPGPGCRTNKNALSEVVKNNMALLKLAEIKNVVPNIGIKLSPTIYIVHELPPEYPLSDTVIEFCIRYDA